METYWVRRRLLSAEKLNLQGDVPQIQVITKESHEQALAEKDKKIAYLQECRTSAAAMDAQRAIEYQQLMEKAMRFAKAVYDPNVIDNDPIYAEAQAFLKEREQP